MYQGRSRIRRAIVTAVAIASIAVLAACSSQTAGKGTAAHKLHFVAIVKTLDNPAYQVFFKGAKERIKELGGNIDFEWTAPAGADPAKQVQLIESYVQRGVDGLIVSALGPSVCTAVAEAVSAGVPVVTFGGDCPKSGRQTFVGSDDFAGGYKAGQLYVAAVKDKGQQRIAILTGVVGATDLAARDEGFKKALKDSGIDYKIAVTVPGQDDLTKSVEAVESTLRGDPAINGFFFDGPWPLLVDRSNLPVMMEKINSGRLTVFSFDTLQQELPWVKDGLVGALIGQKYYGFGYQGMTVLDGIVRKKSNYGEFVRLGFDIVTKDGGGKYFTPAQMDQAWKTSDFKETPVKPKS
jgi:ribose transport system substrate-binding protein